MLAVVRNFTVGVGSDGRPSAWFDAYYDEGLSVPVTLATADAIIRFLHAAGLLTAPKVDGTACLLDASGDTPTFLHVASV